MLRGVAFVALFSLLLASARAAGDVVIYDDASKNGFDQNCSFFVTPNFANTSPVHSGAHSISFAPSQYGAVSWCTPAVESTTTYSGLSFWVNGGATGNQNLEVVFGSQGAVMAQASIDALLGHPIAANAWAQVTASLDAAALLYSGNFDQISIQDNSGNLVGSPQPTVYFDDVVLLGRVSDQIFKNGFEAAVIVYTVTASAPGGNGSITPASQSVNSGNTASFTVTPNANSHVTGVTGDHCTVTQQGATTTWASGAITQNCAVTATFAINQYTVNATVSGGNGSITPSSQIVNSGNTASFTVTPNASYSIGGVTGDHCSVTLSSGSTWVSDAITQNCAVTATFTSILLPPPACGMTDQHDQSVAPATGDTMISDVFDWCDSAGKPREAVLAHNDQTGKNAGGYANHGGSLQQFSYQMPDTSTRTATITTYGNGGYGGFGYVVSHSAWLPPNGYCNGDDSPLGYSYSGTWTRVFEGRHHAIFRFQQQYQRHCGPNNPAPTTFVPVTIDWIFSTGRDNPLWAITYDISAATKSDATAITADFLFDDSRAPYGELNIDGDGFTYDISGVAWGDFYKFTSTTAPVTLSSAWTWNAPNTIPYVKEWIVASNATMGLVQTQTIGRQDAGGGRNPYYRDLTAYWTKTSANGDACPDLGYLMPCQDGWPYQANNDNLGVGTSSNNARLTWGTQYGFLGQTTYASNQTTLPDPDNGPNLPGWPKKSYSVYVVLGPHSTLPVEAQVAQVETVQSLALSASVGSVATSGPAGVNRADTTTYSPAGYDQIYGALTFVASAGNALDANISVGSGTLSNPLIIVRNYTSSAYPTSVKLNSTVLAIDVDYFPSLRGSSNEQWLTLNGNLSGATNHLQVTP
jgi:hypothetical protein